MAEAECLMRAHSTLRHSTPLNFPKGIHLPQGSGAHPPMDGLRPMTNLNDRQIQALTFLVVTTRPTGAPKWDHAGVAAAIHRLVDRGLSAQEVIDRTMRHTWDRSAKTPGVLMSPAPSTVVESNPTVYPVRRGEDCPLHTGERREHCRCCAADRLAGDVTKPPNLARDVDLSPVVAELKGLSRPETTTRTSGHPEGGSA